MLERLDDTIAAVASPPGAGWRGIVRISGPHVRQILEQALTLDDPVRWKALSQAAIHAARWSRTPEGPSLPITIYSWPGRRSYTGEPMAELHCLGVPPLLDAVLQRLFQCGAIPAVSGEFTLRSFLNQRIDLIQAEAVLGVIEASDQHLLQRALAQLAGGISRQIAELRERLLIDLADLEVGLDFVEEDIEFIDRQEFLQRLESAARFIDQLLCQAAGRMQSVASRRVVLAGLPNAGKSSLFNCLTEQEGALVSPLPGTTRDYLSATVTWQGMDVELIDTAGWEAAPQGPLSMALQSAREVCRSANLILWCSPSVQTSAESVRDADLLHKTLAHGVDLLQVRTKGDLPEWSEQKPTSELVVSIDQPESIGRLRQAIVERLSSHSLANLELPASTGARCHESLLKAAESLERAMILAGKGGDDALISVELRAAIDSLGSIVGKTYTDDILDRIFSRFCIGK